MGRNMLLGPRDKAVYAWEGRYVNPYDPTPTVAVETRGLVPYMWERMGLMRPPKVELMPRWNPYEGRGNRHEVTFGVETRLTTIIHELAHSMDVSIETSVGATALRPDSEVGGGSYHDDNWLGLYVEMLDRFIGGRHFNKLWLYKTLTDSGLTVSYAPKPRCI